MKCTFCNLDNSKKENINILETKNFLVKPAKGSLVDGYIIIISKRHLNSMANLTQEEFFEYKNLIKKYRKIFKIIYGKYPVVFEHGTPIINSDRKANSINHAHTHIVNHNFINELNLIKELDFKILRNKNKMDFKNNYIFYINHLGKWYISYNFKSESQLMRKYIANDLKISDKYDWKKINFYENIDSTVKKLREYE